MLVLTNTLGNKWFKHKTELEVVLTLAKERIKEMERCVTSLRDEETIKQLRKIVKNHKAAHLLHTAVE